MLLTKREFLLGSAAAGAALTLARPGSAFAQTPRKGGTIRIAVNGSAADTMDAADYVSAGDLIRALQVYDSLAELDEDFKVRLALAEEMTAETADSWLIRLKPDLFFHDGRKVTADDVLYSIARIVSPKTPKQGALGLTMVDVANSKKLDERTLRLKLSKPNSLLVEEFTQIWNPIVPTGFDPKNPIGTGPYKVKSFTPGRETTLVRNDQYWRDAPHADEISIIVFSDDTARLTALMGGQVDIVPSASASQMRVVESIPFIKTFNQPSGRWEPYVMRCDVEPFKDVRVRQAMRLIVDRQQIVDQVYAGNARVANDLFGGMDADYASQLPQRVQDIDQAKSLLKAAGHSDLKLEIVTAPLGDTMVSAAEVFAQQAKTVNVEIAVRRIDPASFFGPDFLTRTFTQDSWGNFPIVPIMSLTLLKGASNNETGWRDERTDKLFNAARMELDPAKRKQILFDVQKVLYDEGGYIIPSFTNSLALYSEKVVGYPAQPAETSDFNHQYRKLWLA